MTILTHKIKLDATYKQQVYFRKACGIARFAWNWALARWNEKYQAKIKTSALELKKEFNALKDSVFPWVYEVTKYACQQPFIYLKKAFQAFFNKKAKYPQFKKKGIRDSFYVGGDQLKTEGYRVKIPLIGWIRLRETLRFQGKIQGATISRIADKWFISIHVMIEQTPVACESQASIGIDLGIKTMATLSNGQSVPNIKPLRNKLFRLKRLQRRLSKRTKGSKNRAKAQLSLAKLHYQISCQRKDYLHKLTTQLTDKYRYIAIEELHVSEMVKNKSLARQIMDVGWFEFRRQLEYKARLKGNILFIADKWFASTKTCSACGHCVDTMSLSERTYYCSECGLILDRDLNAAKCLEKLINTASSAGINACGQDSSVIML